MRILFTLLVLLQNLAHANENPYNFPTHCNIDEQIIFSCKIKNKFVSVCSEKSKPNKITYRYGNIGSPEFIFPNPLASKSDQINYGTAFSAPHGISHINFTNSSHQYFVYKKTYQLHKD